MGVGDQRHAPAALLPGNRPGTHFTGEWVGQRTGPDRCVKSHSLTGIRSPDRPAHNSSSSQEFTCPLLKPNVHYRVNKGQPPVPILSQINLGLPPHPISSRNILILGPGVA
jgi:hypothetical protein